MGEAIVRIAVSTVVTAAVFTALLHVPALRARVPASWSLRSRIVAGLLIGFGAGVAGTATTALLHQARF